MLLDRTLQKIYFVGRVILTAVPYFFHQSHEAEKLTEFTCTLEISQTSSFSTCETLESEVVLAMTLVKIVCTLYRCARTNVGIRFHQA